MKSYRSIVPAALFALLSLGCDAFSQGAPAGGDVLARAEGHRFTVDQAVELLASQDQLPNQPEVVEALADLWVDYVLLARAAAADTTLATVDLAPVVRQQIEQEMVYRLRDRVVQPDTVISEEELRAAYEAESPGAQVRARHILLPYPDGASQAQRDSVRSRIEGLRGRAVGGESFESLAQEHSGDPGSAQQGGDLGFFGRGDMVRSFEEAAFALEPGQISEPVETPYGLHILKVEERQVPEFEGVRDQYLMQLRGVRIAQAESVFVAGLEEPADIQIQEGAYEVARELARRPAARLTRRAAARGLVQYRGGSFTAGEFQEFIQARPPGFRAQVHQASDDQLEGLLRNLTRGELLVNAARERDVELSEEEREQLMTEARNRFVQAARAVDVYQVTPGEEETFDQAVDRIVFQGLQEILQGERDVIPLGAISFSLRRRYDSDVYAAAVNRVVERLDQARAESRPTPPTPVPVVPAPAEEDTGARPPLPPGEPGP